MLPIIEIRKVRLHGTNLAVAELLDQSHDLEAVSTKKK